MNNISEKELFYILEIVKNYNLIIVGGQAIYFLYNIYKIKNKNLEKLGPLTSKDIDFLNCNHNQKFEIENIITKKLDNGQLIISRMDDNTPNTAVIQGYIDKKLITIDFLSKIKGVENKSVFKKHIIYSINNESIEVKILHPFDCLKSRFANINELKRTDEHSIKQAEASIIILDCYIDECLQNNNLKKDATEIIKNLEFFIKNKHKGKITDKRYHERLNIEKIIEKYSKDERIDSRFKKMIIEKILNRLNKNDITPK